jgi:D-alanyl-D-alanine endopeptidase (penicillin-binding protein 7)
MRGLFACRQKSACALQIVCYNAETFRNNLGHKGLPVIRSRFGVASRLICFLAALAAFGLPTNSNAAVSGSSKKPAATAKKAPVKKATTVRKTAASRRARAARARAVRQAAALREAIEPRFKFDELGNVVPDVRAEAAIIYNPETGKVLWESNSTTRRSIASITKVMTAVVFLENSPDLTREVVVERADVRNASTTYLRAGYTLTTGDLLHLLLIGSDNAAARVLARVSPFGSQGFIDRMNAKAQELGLTSTSYADPSGLLADNESSAYDLARLISYVSGDDRIASIMRTPYYTVNAGRRQITIHSTNQLVMKGDVDVQAGKTGFISKAGYCLATLLRMPQGGPEVAVVVLGAKSNPGRFWETRHLFNWISTKAQDWFGQATPATATSTAQIPALVPAAN